MSDALAEAEAGASDAGADAAEARVDAAMAGEAEAATPKARAGKPAAKKAPGTEAKPARKPVAKDGKPETLTKPRGGKGDDLKMIKGVGPALEKKLNELGFWHFDQIAGWRKKEVEWVDDNLNFKGRIERDDWIKQAKQLAKGGETDFSKRVAKGKVY